MLSNYIPNAGARERLQRRRCGADLDGFSDWLGNARYSAETIRSYIFAAARYDAWARERHHDMASALIPSELDAYRAYLTHRHPERRRPDGGNDYCGAHRFAKYLRERSGIKVDVPSEATSLEMRFVDWLRRHRGVCPRTAEGYALKVRRLLSALGPEPQMYSAAQLRTTYWHSLADSGTVTSTALSPVSACLYGSWSSIKSALRGCSTRFPASQNGKRRPFLAIFVRSTFSG